MTHGGGEKLEDDVSTEATGNVLRNLCLEDFKLALSQVQAMAALLWSQESPQKC